MSIINTHLYSGASIFLTKKNFFDKDFWILMNKIKVTNFGGVPFAFEILNKIKFYEKKLPNLKTVTQAGGKLNNEIMLKFIRLFKPSFGQQEISAIKKIFKKSWIGFGPEVKKFEDNLFYLSGTNVSYKDGLIKYNCGSSPEDFNEKKFDNFCETDKSNDLQGSH